MDGAEVVRSSGARIPSLPILLLLLTTMLSAASHSEASPAAQRGGDFGHGHGHFHSHGHGGHGHHPVPHGHHGHHGFGPPPVRPGGAGFGAGNRQESIVNVRGPLGGSVTVQTSSSSGIVGGGRPGRPGVVG